MCSMFSVTWSIILLCWIRVSSMGTQVGRYIKSPHFLVLFCPFLRRLNLLNTIYTAAFYDLYCPGAYKPSNTSRQAHTVLGLKEIYRAIMHHTGDSALPIAQLLTPVAKKKQKKKNTAQPLFFRQT